MDNVTREQLKNEYLGYINKMTRQELKAECNRLRELLYGTYPTKDKELARISKTQFEIVREKLDFGAIMEAQSRRY